MEGEFCCRQQTDIESKQCVVGCNLTPFLVFV